TVKQAETIINKLNDNFDTHDFIIQFTKDFEREYIELLYHHKGKQHIFMSAHAEIGKFLADNAEELSIEKVTKENSENIKDYPSENQKWRKM
ncbi:MAG: hypothetical protein IJT13_01965, partial [Bacteroidaceae bacterium]|nr:hypothetical protein [Bacteroidaceae bacterium]